MFDELDLEIIRLLQHNGRQSNTQLAKKLGVSETTIRKRINRLIKEKAVRFTLVMDHYKFGYGVTVMMMLNTEFGKSVLVAEQLAKYENAYAVAVLAGQYDVIATMYFKSHDDFLHFYTAELGAIKEIRKSESIMVIRWLKRAYELIMLSEDMTGISRVQKIQQSSRRKPRVNS